MIFACKYFNSKHKHISQLSILAMNLFDWPIIIISYQSFESKIWRYNLNFLSFLMLNFYCHFVQFSLFVYFHHIHECVIYWMLFILTFISSIVFLRFNFLRFTSFQTQTSPLIDWLSITMTCILSNV